MLLDDLKSMISRIDEKHYPSAVIGIRDHAILLTGFAGAFRRSELAEMDFGDISLQASDGVHVRLRHSKTDQEGRGSVRALPYGSNPITCPPCALAKWVRIMSADQDGGRPAVMAEVSRIATAPDGHVCRSWPEVSSLDGDSPLFTPVHKTGRIGQSRLSGEAISFRVKARVKAAGMDPSRFAGHSLRSGFVTQAVRAGADTGAIMRQTGHHSPAMVEVYRRENAPLIGNAVVSLGL